MATCNASTLLAANPFTRLDPGLAQACKLQLLCDISSNGGGGGGGIGGSGTAGTLAKFTAGTTLGNSIISESGAVASVAGGVTMTGQLTVNRGTLTASAPAIDITSTWNNAGVTFTGMQYNVTDTASASGSLLMDLQVGGTTRFSARKDGFYTFAGTGANNSPFTIDVTQSNKTVISATRNVEVNPGVGWLLVCTQGILAATSSTLQISNDAILARDAANALANRNTTNAQSFRVYNTFTSSTNFERGVFDWQTTAGVLRIGTEKGSGGGSARALEFVTDGTARWQITTAGNLIAATDASFDIGAIGATRPRNYYGSGDVQVGGGVQVAAANFYAFATRGTIAASANGVFLLRNAAATDFDRLQFGGTTSSFPALKRNGAILDVKLADDSAYASLGAEFISVTDGMTAPAAVSGRARIYVDTADGDLKVVFGDGTVKTIVTDT